MSTLPVKSNIVNGNGTKGETIPSHSTESMWILGFSYHFSLS